MFLSTGDLTVHVAVDGPEHAPALLLLHSLGTSLHVWDDTATALATRYRVIRPDMRGHGLTSVMKGPYQMGVLAQDALAVLSALGVVRAHVAGLSIGGAVAQAIAAAAPGRVASLVLCATALAFPPPELWRERAQAVRAGGTEAILAQVLARWITPEFTEAPAADGLRAMLRRTDPEGYAGAAEALAAADFTRGSTAIRVPTLVLVGEHDQATPLDRAEALRDAIPGAELTVLPGVAHIPTMQRPADVTAAMAGFLVRHAGA